MCDSNEAKGDSRRHSARIHVDLVPIGQPGRVDFVVQNAGPELLNKDEIVATLRMAADLLEWSSSADPKLDPVKSATVDRRTVSAMTVRAVMDRYLRALECGEMTASDSHELDYVQDLVRALDEELAEHRDARKDGRRLDS